MARLLDEASDSMDTDLSSIVASEAPVPKVEKPVNRTEIRLMMEDALNKLTEKLDKRVAQWKNSIFETIENIVDDRNMTFVPGSLRRAIYYKLASVTNDKRFEIVFDKETSE